MRKTYLPIFLISLAITVIQVLICCSQSSGDTFSKRYASLFQWDSYWYYSIAHDGYHTPVPPVRQAAAISNVAFFPLYPKLASLVSQIFHLDVVYGLLITSQLSCVILWFFFLLILTKWRVPWPVSTGLIFLLLSIPPLFFLVAAYSESTFLASMLAYFYFSLFPRKYPLGQWIAGIALTSSRLVGVALVGFPVFLTVLKRGDRKTLAKAFLASMVSLMGAISFLVYCQLKFGAWDIYWQTQKIGWGITPDYTALLAWNFGPFVTVLDSYAFSLSYTGILLFFAIELGVAKNQKSLDPVRMAINLCVAILFYLTASGIRNVNFRSINRYSLPFCFSWALITSHLLSQNFKFRYRFLILCILISALMFYFVTVQPIWEFTQGIWVG